MQTTYRTAPQYLEQGTCWTCAIWAWLDVRGYCKPCTLRGLDSPMIDCTGCGCVRRRRFRGEQHFVCTDCRAETCP